MRPAIHFRDFWRRHNRLAIFTLCFLICVNSSVTSAQEKKSSGPAAGAGLPSRVPLDKAKCQVTSSEIDDLFKTYADFQRWTDLQKRLSDKVAECTGSKPASEAPYLVTLVRPKESVTVVVPQPERYSSNLPGGPKTVYVLLLVDQHSTDQKSVPEFRLTSSELENDLVTQLPAFAKTAVTAVTGGLLGVFQNRVDQLAIDVQKTPQAKAEAVAYASAGPVVLPASNVSVTQTGSLSVVSDGKAEDVQLTATVTNRTNRRVKYTAVAGALVGRVFGDEKMKVSDDKYASEPISRGLTMAAIAIHPRSYDPTVHDMTSAERIAFLLGGVLTPAPGVGAGLSVGITRGFGINVGGALMFVPTSRDGLLPKQEAPAGKNQLRYGWTSGLFTGISYVFKSD